MALSEVLHKIIRVEEEPKEAAFTRHSDLDIQLHREMRAYQEFARENPDAKIAIAANQKAGEIYSQILDLSVDGNVPQYRNLVLFDRATIPLPPKKI